MPPQFSCDAVNIRLVDVRASKKPRFFAVWRELRVWCHEHTISNSPPNALLAAFFASESSVHHWDIQFNMWGGQRLSPDNKSMPYRFSGSVVFWTCFADLRIGTCAVTVRR